MGALTSTIKTRKTTRIILSAVVLGVHDQRMTFSTDRSENTHDLANQCQVICRLHDLIREHVWTIRMLSILKLVSQVVIPHVCFTQVNI